METYQQSSRQTLLLILRHMVRRGRWFDDIVLKSHDPRGQKDCSFKRGIEDADDGTKTQAVRTGVFESGSCP